MSSSSGHRRDHKVPYKSRETIARIALAWWALADRIGHRFDICAFVIDVLTPRLKAKGVLKIDFCNYDDVPEGACVSFTPLTLHVVRQIWDDAKLGKAYARFIIAHEIGHLILHDKTAVSFSNDDEAKIVHLPKEESAEDQANTFADLFLVPDHVAIKLKDSENIEVLCVVSDPVARRRLADAASEKHPLSPYLGEMCPKCGSFTLISNCAELRCDTCTSRFSGN